MTRHSNRFRVPETLANKSVNRSWLAFRFFNVVSFAYNSRSANVNSVGPPTRLPSAFGGEDSLVTDQSDDYRAPESREDLLRRYASGERNFPGAELSDADLSGVTLDGASFEKWSWFNSANFEGASLRGASFRECNVKCANFRRADLTGASNWQPWRRPSSRGPCLTMRASRGPATMVTPFTTATASRSGGRPPNLALQCRRPAETSCDLIESVLGGPIR